MPKIFVASFNRASNGAISKLVDKLISEDMYTDDYEKSDYILAVGDRKETFDFVLERYRENKKIIHLWAGEKSSFELHDDVYRHAITLMSDFQLCTNNKAKQRVKDLCKSVDKKYCVITIGNIMLDNLEVDEEIDITKEYGVKKGDYDLILYNPVTRESEENILKEIENIEKIRDFNYIWIEPNGDKYSDLLENMVTHYNLPRPEFLRLLKDCNRFITNSSCQYYEAHFLIKPDQIISIGKRNKDRESKVADMSIKHASDNVIKFIREIL